MELKGARITSLTVGNGFEFTVRVPVDGGPGDWGTQDLFRFANSGEPCTVSLFLEPMPVETVAPTPEPTPRPTPDAPADSVVPL